MSSKLDKKIVFTMLEHDQHSLQACDSFNVMRENWLSGSVSFTIPAVQ